MADISCWERVKPVLKYVKLVLRRLFKMVDKPLLSQFLTYIKLVLRIEPVCMSSIFEHTKRRQFLKPVEKDGLFD